MKFISKMRASGYSKETIAGILKSGLTCYYRKVRIELEGGPKLNRRQDNQDVARKRKKIGASEQWFKRRRGGAEEKRKKDHGWRATSGSPGTGPRQEPSTRGSSKDQCWRATSGSPGAGPRQELSKR